MNFPLPANEPARLEALRRLGILDTESELLYDDIVRLASLICETPIALIAFLDKNRQWLKAKVGVNVSETMRSDSFCTHTILNSELLEVGDTLRDPRFAQNPFVVNAPNVRFYAGFPLKTGSDFNLGALCVLDTVARELTAPQKDALTVLARQAMALLELRRTNQELSDKIAMLDQQGHALAQQSKMAALGEMAAGIAHEINNPLAIIIGKCDKVDHLVKQNEIARDEVRQELSVIEKTAFRISTIIQGLRAFSRNLDQQTIESTSIEKIILDALALAAVRAKTAPVELRFDRNTDTRLKCRPVQIEQVVINLLNNAFDAVADLAEKWIEIRVEDRPHSIMVAIRDSGPGLALAIADKAMDPFFTTKPAGRGTGLGLPISKGIVESHGGEIWYNRESPHTEFCFRIPKEAEGTTPTARHRP